MTDAYVREAPNVHVALADAVLRAGEPGERATVATLLSLVERGLATLGPSQRRVTSIFGAVDRATYQFVVDVTRWTEFDPLDQSLVSLLFTTMKRSASMGLLDLRVLLRSRESTYERGMAAWRSDVVARAVTDGWLGADGQRRTAKGEALREQIDALHEFIADFGRFEDDQPMAIELWGPYLVWAALFGEADVVLAAMRVKAVGEREDLALALDTLLH
jgi:hypothetical protein